MPRPVNHLAVIEAIYRGENNTGWPDKTVILTHAREMQRELNELRERIKLASAQQEMFHDDPSQQSRAG